MDPNPVILKSDKEWINIFVGGEIYPIQLRTLLTFENNGLYFRERVVKASEFMIKVSCVHWDSSPNHIKYRMDIDRDGQLFRHILQYLRNGRKTSLPDNQPFLLDLMREADFFGMDGLKYVIKKKLWKLTGKANYFACYSDSE
ncbi:unnamed protein product [Auanema sp. JU1783]|nr:unnamed protein product [Auanema sp. JU1783]